MNAVRPYQQQQQQQHNGDYDNDDEDADNDDDCVFIDAEGFPKPAPLSQALICGMLPTPADTAVVPEPNTIGLSETDLFNIDADAAMAPNPLHYTTSR